MFKDPLHDQLGAWPLAYIPYGGADDGEVERIAAAVGDGDDAVFHDAWCAAADRLMEEAHAALAQGHLDSARDAFLQAAGFYGTAYHPLFGKPVDARLMAGERRQVQAFELGLALGDGGVARLHIPFEGTLPPAYLVPARGRTQERRPLIVFTNGYDGTITDLYFASVVAASRRGYHCLIFDGPGQGRMLFEHGVRLRPDWETVIAAELDFTLAHVDVERIALSGWSLGGYLAGRAAASDTRLAACIVDPGRMRCRRLPPVRSANRRHAGAGGRPGHAAAGRHRPRRCGNPRRPPPALGRDAARLLGARRGQPARLFRRPGTVHAGRPRGRHPLPDAGHARAGRPGRGGCRSLFRCTGLPEDAAAFFQRRRGGAGIARWGTGRCSTGGCSTGWTMCWGRRGNCRRGWFASGSIPVHGADCVRWPAPVTYRRVGTGSPPYVKMRYS
jgi:hypothetical protein